MYFYNARWYDAASGRFVQADSVVPSQNQGTEASKHIQLLLIVDYHEPNLINLLGRIYQDDLLRRAKTDAGQTREKEQLNPNLTNSNQHEEDNSNDTGNSESSLQAFEDFNEKSNLGKQQNTERRDDKSRRNNEIIQVDLEPSRLNMMNLDRYAYTSNCPTRYTDPSGHCDVAKAIGGSAIVLLGGGTFGFGIGLVGLGVIEVSVASPTIVGIFIGFHEMGVGGLMAAAGYLIATKGVEAIIDSDCLIETENTTPN